MDKVAANLGGTAAGIAGEQRGAVLDDRHTPGAFLQLLYAVEHSLKTLDVPADIEWAMLVAYHRGRMEAARGTKFFQKYQELDKGYDMVIGSIANDRMFYVLDSFFEGTITDTALVKSLSALKLGRQYVAITQKACDVVKIEREVQLLWIERQALKKASEQNRSNGIAFANQICKEYRREGLFFDEILDGAKQRR